MSSLAQATGRVNQTVGGWMRWTDEGAHCLAQVRVAVLNGEFAVKGLAELAKTASANLPQLHTAA
jgi:hypothetical protein